MLRQQNTQLNENIQEYVTKFELKLIEQVTIECEEKDKIIEELHKRLYPPHVSSINSPSSLDSEYKQKYEECLKDKETLYTVQEKLKEDLRKISDILGKCQSENQILSQFSSDDVEGEMIRNQCDKNLEKCQSDLYQIIEHINEQCGKENADIKAIFDEEKEKLQQRVEELTAKVEELNTEKETLARVIETHEEDNTNYQLLEEDNNRKAQTIRKLNIENLSLGTKVSEYEFKFETEFDELNENIQNLTGENKAIKARFQSLSIENEKLLKEIENYTLQIKDDSDQIKENRTLRQQNSKLKGENTQNSKLIESLKSEINRLNDIQKQMFSYIEKLKICINTPDNCADKKDLLRAHTFGFNFR